MTLSFFTITVITITITLASVYGNGSDPKFEFSLAYLSLAMFCFFIGSYMYIFRRRIKRNPPQLSLPYIGETLEFVGIIALGTGLFYVVTLVAFESEVLPILYLSFLVALVAVAVYELYQNKAYLHPRKKVQ